MAHSQSHEAPPASAAARQRRRAIHLMVVVLVPLAIWTLAGLIYFWPDQVSAHLARDATGDTVAGATYPSARITHVSAVSCGAGTGVGPAPGQQACATEEAKLLSGPDRGRTVQVALTDAAQGSGTRVGQRVILLRLPAVDGQPVTYQFSDFARGTPLLVLTLVFAAAVLVVGRWRGLASLVGLAFAGFVLVRFVLPALVSGTHPLVVGLLGCSAILFVVVYAAAGFSVPTTTALVSALVGLIVIAVLTEVAGRWAHLTGTSDDADYALATSAPDLRLTSVAVCGTIIVGLGVLIQVAVTQAGAVWQLAEADPGRGHLFSAVMRGGSGRVPSTVLILTFTAVGAALPLLLTIVLNDRPLLALVQTGQFADQLVRTLVASIGLVLAVPLTTAVGVGVVRASRAGGRAASRSGPPTSTPPPDDQPAEPRSVVIRGRRKGRDDFDDLDFSDLHDPRADDTTVRRPR